MAACALDALDVPSVASQLCLESLLRVQATCKTVQASCASHPEWRAAVALCRSTPRPSLHPSEWIRGHERLIRYAIETGHLEVRLQLVGISEEYRDIYSSHPALKMQWRPCGRPREDLGGGLVHLPGHGVLAELDFGVENDFDPDYIEPPPAEEYDMSDAPPNWFAQAALATAVRFVASWRGGEPLTLVEFTKPADDVWGGLTWLEAAAADGIGFWTSIMEHCALRAKCVFPSSAILRVLGLPACQERGEGQTASVFLSGTVRREPPSWPESWVNERDFELQDCFERWDDPTPGEKLDIPCVRFSQELHHASLVSVDAVPYWRKHEVSEWWKRGMETPHALAVGARLGVAADAEWPPLGLCGRTWLGLWAIDDRGHTEWEAPVIPLRADHNLDGLAEGAFRTLPCSLGTSDPRFASIGPTSQTIAYLHPDSGIFMLFILPSNLRASFGESWREYWTTRWVEAIRRESTTGAS